MKSSRSSRTSARTVAPLWALCAAPFLAGLIAAKLGSGHAEMTTGPMPTPSASSTGNPAPDSIQVFREIGKPVTISWKDGREAQFQIAVNPPASIPVPFEVTENTCTGRTGIKCHYQLPARADSVGLRWTRHPDPERVGKTVIKVSRFGTERPTEDLLQDQVLLLTGDRFLAPDVAGDLTPDEILCEDYSWLPGGGAKMPPESFTVTRWEYELMSRNPETDLDENRTQGGAHGVTFKRTPRGTFALEHVKYFTGFAGSTALFLGDIVGLVVPTPDGDFCNYSLKADLASVQPQVAAYLGRLPDAFKPYPYGSSALSAYADPDSYLVTPWKKDDNGVTVEAEVK